MENYNTYGITVKDFAILMLKFSKIGKFFLFTGIIFLINRHYLSALFIPFGFFNIYIVLYLHEKKELITALLEGIIFHNDAAILENDNYNELYSKDKLLCRTMNTDNEKYVTKIYISGIFFALYLYFIRSLPFSNYE
jgi:hypothetical protein